jgi:peptide/nickel transport system substrate-binding protein
MKIPTRCLGLAAAAAIVSVSSPSLAQKAGGVLKIQHMDTPPSASIHEEATVSSVVPLQQPRHLRSKRRPQQP